MSKIMTYSDFYTDVYEYDRNGENKKVETIEVKQPNDIKKFFSQRGYCPFCMTTIPKVYNDISSFTLGVEMWSFLDIWECPQCGWWESLIKYSEEEDHISKVVTKNWDTLHHGIIKKYDLTDKEIPVEALLNELIKKKDILYHINPYKLEEIAQVVFSAYYNCEVKHVGKTGDGGVDLLLVQSDNPILVQVKRRKNPNHVELVKPIREFVGAMFLKDAKKGIYLSTAKDFSKGSKEIQKNVIDNRKFDYFELVDFNRFISMSNCLTENDIKPWNPIVKKFGFKK